MSDWLFIVLLVVYALPLATNVSQHIITQSMIVVVGVMVLLSMQDNE